jgi:protein TonB
MPPGSGDQTRRGAPPWPWRAMTASALLHVAVAAVLMWWNPSPRHTAPNVAVEIVFLPGEDAGAEPPSGAMAAQEAPQEGAALAEAPDEPPAEPETQVAEAPPTAELEVAPPPEPPSETAPQPIEAAAVEQRVEPIEIAPRPEPIAPVAEALLPEPAPTVAELPPAVQVLPPPPTPWPVAAKSKPVERKPQVVAPAAAVPTPAPAAPPEPAQIAVATPAPAAATPAPTAASAAPPAAAEQAEPPVVHEPRYRHPPSPPRFPPRALELHQQGTVVVRALVAPDGSSGEILVWRSSGYALLDAAALRAVRDWAFEPASVGGRRIASWVEVPVRFAIR